MKRRLIGSLAGLALAAGAMVATAVPAPAGILAAETFDNPSLNPQTYIVPEGCTAVTVEAFGAEGGNGGGLEPIIGADGANGGSSSAIVPVTGGESLEVNVGGEGGNAPLIAVSPGGDGGINGGGAGGSGLLLGGGGGGGGGASDVRRLGTPLVVAGGGGGGGSGLLALLLGGDGGAGGTSGANGEDFLAGGQGGQAGGLGAAGGNDGLLGLGGGNGAAGAAGIGGDGGDGADLLIFDLIFGGGGGGGGATGGGGGGAGQVGVGAGGGGGGSNLGTTHGEGVETGEGRVIITPVATSCDGGEPPDRDCTDPPPLFFQPDATRESPRLGNDVYDDGSGDFQTQVEFVKPRFGSTLDIYIQNDGNQPDSFVLTGPAGAPPFLVRYQQLKAADGSLPKNYITEQVTGAGFTTGTLPACGEMKVRIQVKVSVNAQPGQEANLPLTVTSVGDGGVSDTARLIVRVIAP